MCLQELLSCLDYSVAADEVQLLKIFFLLDSLIGSI